jgi:transcriptional regulator with XRE-family HTH domain
MAKDLFSSWLKNDSVAEEIYFQENFIIEVYETLQKEMDRQGVSRKELSERVGKSKAYISQVLGGTRNMTLRTLADFCRALEVYPEIKLSKHKKEAYRHYEYEDVGMHFQEAEERYVETSFSSKKMRVVEVQYEAA